MRARTPFDRLTASDMFLLLWDDYGWRSDIGGLAVLDGSGLLDPEGRVRIDELRQCVQARLHLVPRFRQLLHRPRLGLGWPLWVDAPTFDIAHHVRVEPLEVPVGGTGEVELLAACAQLAQRPMDLAQPLWELWLMPGLPDRRVGAYLKLHHAVADGGAALATFAALLDLSPDTPTTPTAPTWTPQAIPSATALAWDNLRRRTRELGRGTSGLAHPRRTLGETRRVLPAWREVLTEDHAPRTSLNRPVTDQRQLAVVRSRLDHVKDVAHRHAATINDVVLTVVAGGLRELLISRGEPVRGLHQRAMVTISLHDEPGQAQGNKPGWMMVSLPLDEPDPVRRLEQIAAQTKAGKHKPRPQAGTGIFRFIAGQRLWYRAFPRQTAVNIVVTNVPGPPAPLYLAGARLLEVFPVMCVMGNLTLVVGALSYDGQLNVTAIADGVAPDIEVFTAGVRHGLEGLGATGGRASEGPHQQTRPIPR